MSDLGCSVHVIHARDSPGDAALAVVATDQHGVVAHRQLVSLGFGRGAISHRLAMGRLHRTHPGVYAVGHSALEWRGRLMAAVLACGPGSLLSHRSAGALWGLLTDSRSTIDVTAARRSRVGTRGVILHRVRGLHEDDRAWVDGIPVTSVARVLLDLAETVRRPQLERAIEEAERLGLFDLAALERLCERSRGRCGLRPLRAVLADMQPVAPIIRSELERRFLSLCRAAGLPAPSVNVYVNGLEVDALWRDQRLVVELDGEAFHRTRAAFERDRTRDAALLLAGHRVIRVTHRRLEREPAAVIEMMRALLGVG